MTQITSAVNDDGYRSSADLVHCQRQDEAQTCNIIADFAKANENLEIIGAIDESGTTLSREDVMALAKLPSREVLTAQVVGTIAAPLSGFVRVLNGNITQLLYALNAIQDKKGEA